MALSEDVSTNRLPFALVNCPEDYRLFISVKDFTHEKINLGFGLVTGYENDIKNDVKFQVRDPLGNIVPGYSLQNIPSIPNSNGFIETKAQADAGPNINNTNPAGYKPITIQPAMNGDYIIEFDLPSAGNSRVFKYFDFTVTHDYTQIPGRIWSKAWQFSSGSNDGSTYQSFADLYIFSNDGIVTKLNTNGIAGGIWGIFSNEVGSSTTGLWNERRKSIKGNSTVLPQYKIFLSDPDPDLYPTGIAGVLNSFQKKSIDCDTIMAFEADVSKSGNIELLFDVPPLNPGTMGAEDVQLAFPVTAGINYLNPGWDGLDAFGVPVATNSQIVVRYRFLNGLCNLPLYDVEYNPEGFKVDIVRPIPPSGETKLRLFWDDRDLGADATSNITEGCVYSGVSPSSGCHQWTSVKIGDVNTLNSWWYYAGELSAPISYTFKLSSPTGAISGPTNVCEGQRALYYTKSLPFANVYIWEISGPNAYSKTIQKNAPDSTFEFEFKQGMAFGEYSIKVLGKNIICGNGPLATYTANLSENSTPVIGPDAVCTEIDNQFTITGTHSEFNWSCSKGNVIGSNKINPAIFRWNTPGLDTLVVTTKSIDCGTRVLKVPVQIQTSAAASFSSSIDTTCPDIPIFFVDNSTLGSGSIIERNWIWDDGNTTTGNISTAEHTFLYKGIKNIQLQVTTDKGCITTGSKAITIIPKPVAAIDVYKNCISDTLQLSDNSTGTGINSWLWKFPVSPEVADNLNTSHPLVLYKNEGDYPVQLIINSRFGCTDTLNSSIRIHKFPTAEFETPLLCSNTVLNLLDSSTVADTSLADYEWIIQHTSQNNQVYSGKSPAVFFESDSEYTITHKVTDHFGCSNTISRVVSVLTRPDAEFSFSEIGGENSGELLFSNESVGADNYTWQFGNGITSYEETPSVKYENEGEYLIQLVGSSKEGCHDTTTFLYIYSIPDLQMPNAFTPGLDALNNVFLPILPRMSLMPYTFQIYNRFGQMLFETHDPFLGWDGTFQNKPCQIGTYVWVVRYQKKENESIIPAIQQGMVTLVR